MAEAQQHFFRRIWTRLPVLFPLVALFHIAILIITVFSFSQTGVLDNITLWGTCLELLLYTTLWVLLCLRFRWAVISYILLTCANLGLLYLTPKLSIWKGIADAMAPAHLPIDVLFCFFLLFFYKRFR